MCESEASATPEVTEAAIPQVGVLQAVTNNLFCDVGLQSIALVILGQAIATDPILSAEDTWGWHEFTPEDNTCWKQFRLESKALGHISPEALLENLDYLIARTQEAILEVVADAKPQSIIAGTVRLNVGMVTSGERLYDDKTKMNMWLMWISQNNED